LNIEPATRTFTKDGGGAAIIITAGAGESWTVTTTNSWLNITPTKAGTGPGTATYLVSANLTANQRIGSIRINSEVHTVYQNGYVATVDPESGTYERDGGSGSVRVSAPAGVAWTAASNDDWITLTSGAQGSATGTVSFRVSAFAGTGSRVGSISVAGKVVTITQSGVPIALSPEGVRVDDKSNLILFSVNALGTQQWTVTPQEPWITVITPGTGSGDSAVTLVVGENPSFNQRVGTVAVGAAEFSITQAGNSNPTVSLEPPSATAGAAGAFGLIAIAATPDAPWTAESDVPWLTITENKQGAGNANVRYVVSANPGLSERNGTVTITAKAQQPPADLTRSLVAHYLGQETRNLVGRPQNLTGSLTFEANESFVDGLLARRADEFAFSFWFRPSYVGRINRLIEVASSDSTQFALYAGEDNRLTVHLQGSGSPDIKLPTDYIVDADRWQHLIGVLRGTNHLILFASQQRILDVTLPRTPIPNGANTGRIRFGRGVLPVDGYFNGAIRDARFYHRGLIDEEIGLLVDLENNNQQAAIYGSADPDDSQRRLAEFSFRGNGLDTSRNGHTVSLGTIPTTSDRFGRDDSALELLPTDTFGADIESSPDRSITINSWVYWDAATTGGLVESWANAPFKLRFAANGFRFGEIPIEKAIAVNQWHMLTVVAEFAGVEAIRFDTAGSLVGTRDYYFSVFIDGSIVYRSDPIRSDSVKEWFKPAANLLGHVGVVFKSLHAKVDDLSLFNRALTPASVAQVYENERPKRVRHELRQTAASANLSALRGDYPAAGGVGRVDVSIPSGVSWSARSNVPWISVVSGADGAGSGSVSFNIEPNGAITSRHGALTIAGQGYTVIQKGRNHSVDQRILAFGPDGGLGIFNVATEVNAAWAAIPSDGWITVAQGQTGTGPGAVFVVTSPYSSPTGYRSGTVTVGDAVVQVTQVGYEAGVVPLAQAVSPNGGTNNVTVSVPIGAVWEAVSRVSWITLIGGQNRSGSGELSYIVAGNTGEARSGTIIVSGKEVTITQSGAQVGDSNLNGIPDSWELTNLGSLAFLATDDPDADGFSNYLEWRYSTNPQAKGSTPDADLQAFPAVDVTFSSVVGVQYQLEGSSDFTDWQPIGSLLPGTGGAVSRSVRLEGNAYRFFRVRLK
jgi:hypothetical protein